MPAISDAIRQPLLWNPSTSIPDAISHFASGGCSGATSCA